MLLRPLSAFALVLVLVIGATADAADSAKPAKKSKQGKAAAKSDVHAPAFNSASEAGPDFQIQGEYEGTLGDDKVKLGVQVIAQGNGKFHAVGFRGGLPGAGWDRSDRIEGDGERKDGVVTFSNAERQLTAVIADEALTVRDAQGKTVGVLKKVLRESPTLGAKPPAGALVLFDGTTTDKFEKAEMTPDHLLMQGPVSRQKFGDASYHLEFRLPFMPFSSGQARANSGFYVQGRYEIQILDSFGLPGLDNECGGIYKIAKPAVNMCLPPLSWQTYDVDFTAARFKDGKKVDDARVTVRHNGVVIQDHLKLPGQTPGGVLKAETPEPGPVYLQNHHSDPVRFRNVWVLPCDGGAK